MNEDYLLNSYNFELPEELIAQYPCEKKDSSRLLCLNIQDADKRFNDALFEELPIYLPKNALLVANNAKVLPCRIKWSRPSGGKAEFLLLSPLPLILGSARKDSTGFYVSQAEALLKPGAKFKTGQILRLCEDLECEIIKKGEYGRHLVDLRWRGNLEEIFNNNGNPPLPPYIKREAEFEDRHRYQTIYASKNGAMAAPTAGLHFTPSLRQALINKGITWHEITLYVGYGTFSPVRHENILQHKMHKEYIEIDQETASTINIAKKEGRPIICVGTTSMRALEGVAQSLGKIGEYSGWTDIFIYPGYDFKIANGLVTNFHLPKSSLLMLVAAFTGRKKILEAYQYAIKNNYRFFSYGDAMLIQQRKDHER